MAIFHGTKHDDNLTGTSGNDTFDLYKGGNDTAFGDAGNDTFNMDGSLNAGDRLDGGADKDTVVLHGDYSAGLVFDGQTIQNIEVLRLGAGFDYNLTTADGNVAAGGKLTINAAQLGSANHLTFDGSAELDGRFIVYGGAGDDTVTGGAKADIFHLEGGGSDSVHGGGGNDVFYLGDAFTSSDQIDGGGGKDTVVLDGDYTTQTGLFFQNNSVETVKLTAGHSYNLLLHNPFNVPVLDASALGTGDTLTLNANFAGGDILVKSGAGMDQIKDAAFNTGHMTYSYLGIPLSGDTRDVFTSFNVSGNDKFQFHTVNAIDPEVDGGPLSNIGFDSDLAGDIGPSQLHAGDAVVFAPDSGDLQGAFFLIIDGNGVAGYQAGADLVMESYGGAIQNLTPANFIG
jgi:Ca2+-binding RTX toxin-like protein